jgi:quinoprotein glucose dehydrogenase
MSRCTSSSAVSQLWFLSLAILFGTSTLCAQQAPAGEGWPTYGGDAGGTRYSSSTQITRDNLAHLHPVWTFHTHALDAQRTGLNDASFETTPVLHGHTLYFTSPFDVIFALDAATGEKQWTYDPQVGKLHDRNIVTSRGVATWSGPASNRSSLFPCQNRVFVATMDARLISVDAANGRPCSGFGHAGQSTLSRMSTSQIPMV